MEHQQQDRQLHLQPVVFIVAEVLIILLLAELSYRFVEKPFRRSSWLEKSKHFYTDFKEKKIGAITKGLLMTLLLVGTTTAVFSKEAIKSAHADQLERRLKRDRDKIATANLKAKHASENKTAQKELSQTDLKIAAVNQVDPRLYLKIKNTSATAVGDSVLMDIGPELQAVMPRLVINGKVGRQTDDGLKALQKDLKKNKKTQMVLTTLGQNGSVSSKQIDDLMKKTGSKRQVYWVNTRAAGRPWVDGNNAELKKASKKYRNLHVIDWHGLSDSHADWFAKDQVHPNRTGISHLIRLILQSIANQMDQN